METRGTFIVIANERGTLSVAGCDYTLDRREVVIASGFQNGEAAWDYVDELQARIDTINGRHCNTCEV